MASWQAFAMRTILRFTMKRAGRNGIDVDKTRASLGAPRPEVLKIWPGWNVGPRKVEGLTFETYDRADRPTLRDDLVVLYLHGGGYFVGSPQTHRQLALNMAKHCDAPVLSLDYRLAPMHRFPAALDDAIAAYQWLVKTYPQRHFIIAGDSAGGGLAINTALEARSHGLPRPAAVITFSPWTDMAVTGESVDSNNRSCAMLTAKGVREAAQYYLGNADPRDPRHSPLYADLTGLSPQLIFASTDEVLRDDSTRFAAKAREQGVEVELHLVRGVPHVWPIFARIVPEGRESLRQVQAFVVRTVPPAQSRAA